MADATKNDAGTGQFMIYHLVLDKLGGAAALDGGQWTEITDTLTKLEGKELTVAAAKKRFSRLKAKIDKVVAGEGGAEDSGAGEKIPKTPKKKAAGGSKAKATPKKRKLEDGSADVEATDGIDGGGESGDGQ